MDRFDVVLWNGFLGVREVIGNTQYADEIVFSTDSYEKAELFCQQHEQMYLAEHDRAFYDAMEMADLFA